MNRVVNLPPENLKRLPGLFRGWELSEVLQPDLNYHIEAAGTDTYGTPLLAIFTEVCAAPVDAGSPARRDKDHEHGDPPRELQSEITGDASLTDMGPIMRQSELAARWRLSVRSLETWRSKGRGPNFFRIGGKCFYALRDVEEFERRHRIIARGPVFRSKEDRP